MPHSQVLDFLTHHPSITPLVTTLPFKNLIFGCLIVTVDIFQYTSNVFILMAGRSEVVGWFQLHPESEGRYTATAVRYLSLVLGLRLELRLGLRTGYGEVIWLGVIC